MHPTPQTKLDTQIIRHIIAPHRRPIQRPAHPIPRRIAQTLPILILAHARLRRRRNQPIVDRRVVVNAQIPVPTANLQLVLICCSAAIPVAVPPAVDGGRIEVVVAVAFLSILEPGDAEAAAVAEFLAEGDGHEGEVRG
jgi:hypothetical protein